jgi:5-formyltetrahydrofolate cyclo-ligase
MKPALRRAARQARETFVAGLASAVRQGLERAMANQAGVLLQGDGTLGSHAAVGAECDPFALEARWPGRIAFPRVTAEGLAFHEARFDTMQPGAFGIPEPSPDTPVVRPDIVLVPLLLFDRAGNRLGQGGGHYDRTLRTLRASGPLSAIGVAWDMQEAESLEPDPWDEPLDAVITPTRCLRFPR